MFVYAVVFSSAIPISSCSRDKWVNLANNDIHTLFSLSVCGVNNRYSTPQREENSLFRQGNKYVDIDDKRGS